MTSGPGVAGSTCDGSSGLLFQTESGRTVDAGPWARNLIRIGRKFADAASDSPLTFALSLPILDFAGPLIAAGFIAERAHRRLGGGAGEAVDAVERAQLFRQLCALPIEMPVFLRLSTGKTVRAAFHGVKEAHGEPWALIRYQQASKGACRQFINEANVHRVIFVAGLGTEATENMIGKTVNVRLGLAEGFIADDFACRELIFRSASECALVGVVKRLSEELCEANLAVPNGDGSAAVGTLQDLVRAANLMPADEHFRSKLFTIKAGAKETARWNPALAIFCGSSAYLNQASRFPAAHHVALLSPTESNFEAAVHALNESFLRKLGDIPDRGWAVRRVLRRWAFSGDRQRPDDYCGDGTQFPLRICGICISARDNGRFGVGEPILPMAPSVSACGRCE